MQFSANSNTERLEFDPEEVPPGLVEIQNRAVVRNNRRDPEVHASDFIASHASSKASQSKLMIAHSSEKVDLINIMECFSRSKHRESPTMVESVFAVHPPEQDTKAFVRVEAGEEKLSTHIAERYISSKTTSQVFNSAVGRDCKQAQLWPRLPIPVTGKRVRTRAPHKENEDDHADSDEELTGLDAQLFNASRARSEGKAPSVPDNYALQLCDKVKPYNVSNGLRELSWQENYTVEDAHVAQEQFRTPAEAVRQLVSERMFLLDDHSLEVTLRRKGGASGSSNGSRISTTTSKATLIRQATDRMEVSGIVRSMTDGQAIPEHITAVKEQALERALARHTEAVADAALEMVFQHFLLTICGSTSNGAKKRGSENDAKPPTKKAKVTSAAKAESVEPVLPETELFSWEDIMRCLHAKAGETKATQSRVVAHQDLPSLHLSSSVLERTERRLRALYRGETDAHSLRAVPTIFDYNVSNAHAVLQTRTSHGDDGHAVVKQEKEKEKRTRTRSRQTIKAEPPTTSAAELSAIRIKEKVGGKLIPPHVPTAVWDNQKRSINQK